MSIQEDGALVGYSSMCTCLCFLRRVVLATGLATLAALVGLLPSVHASVLPERRVLAEGLSTLATGVGLLLGMWTVVC